MSLARRHALRPMAGGSLAALALAAGPAAWAQERAVCKEAAAPIPLRVADLMARMTLEEKVAVINALQRWALEDTRLGIPVLLHEESLHGYMATEATMFSQAIALAGSFDTDLMRRLQSLTVTKTGARAGDEEVQPYITRTGLSVSRPVLELKGFQRVTLRPGETRVLSLTIPARQLAIWNKDLVEVNEPGPIRLSSGASSANLSSVTVEIVSNVE